MEKEYLKNTILKMFIEDSLDTLNYNPCNSDGEFSEKMFNKTVENLIEAIIDEEPEMPFTYIRDYLGITI